MTHHTSQLTHSLELKLELKDLLSVSSCYWLDECHPRMT